MNPFNNIDIIQSIESIPKVELDLLLQIWEDDHIQAYQDFIENLNIGKCFLCGQEINSFNEHQPCYHWFLRPEGINKKHFRKYVKEPIEFFKLYTYFRWLANAENPIVNINDLEEETSSTSFMEAAIKYKNIEWAFSIGNTDKEGHQNSFLGHKPHFHIQMIVDGRIFLRFNDFHIPFSDQDLFKIAYIEQTGDRSFLNFSYGMGLSSLEDSSFFNFIDENIEVDNDCDNSTIRRITSIIEPGGFSPDILLRALEESEKTKKSMGGILQGLMPDSKNKTYFSAINGVGMTKRNGKK